MSQTEAIASATGAAVANGDQTTGEGNEFSEEKLTELKEAFCLFDKDGEGKILSSELGTVLRACGFSPSEEQIRSFLCPSEGGNDEENGNEDKAQNAIADPTGSGKVSFTEFLEVCKGMPRPVDERDQLLSAFRVFDKHGTGKLMIEDFRQIMTTMGEKLSDAEFEELMKLTAVDADGEFDYHDLVETLVEGIH